MRPVLINIQTLPSAYGVFIAEMWWIKKKQKPGNIRKHFFFPLINLLSTKTSLLSLKGHKLARGGH